MKNEIDTFLLFFLFLFFSSPLFFSSFFLSFFSFSAMVHKKFYFTNHSFPCTTRHIRVITSGSQDEAKNVMQKEEPRFGKLEVYPGVYEYSHLLIEDWKLGHTYASDVILGEGIGFTPPIAGIIKHSNGMALVVRGPKGKEIYAVGLLECEHYLGFLAAILFTAMFFCLVSEPSFLARLIGALFLGVVCGQIVCEIECRSIQWRLDQRGGDEREILRKRILEVVEL
jgi:hypothetical protein